MLKRLISLFSVFALILSFCQVSLALEQITDITDTMSSNIAYEAGATHGFQFSLPIALPANGYINIIFPAEFGPATAPAVAAPPSAPTGSSGFGTPAYSVAGQTAKVTDGAGCGAGIKTVTGVAARNPGAAGSYNILIEARDNGGVLLADGSIAISIVFNAPFNNVQISATVVSTTNQPVVNNVVPSVMTNDGSLNIVILGSYLGTTYAVNLDDAEITALTDIVVISDGEVHGLVPAGVFPGIYNVQCTTNIGTNTTSAVKLTVSAPAPAADPEITSVAPNPIIANSGTQASVNMIISDSDTAAVDYDMTPDAGSAIPNSGTTVDATVVGGETVNFNYDATAVAPGAYTMTLAVDDNDAGTTGDETENIPIYVFPNW